MKRYIIYAVIALAALAAAYGAGRYTAPAKVVEKEVTKEVKVADTATTKTEAPTKITTTTHYRPAPENPPPPGCPACDPIKETITVVEKGPVTTTTETHEESSRDTRKEILTEREYPRLTLGAGVGSRIVMSPLDLKLAAHANYRFTGPFGVWSSALIAGKESVVLAGLSITF